MSAPKRPRDVPGDATAAADLVAEYTRHVNELPSAAVAPAARGSRDETVVEHALAALAIGEEIARRIRRRCWFHVRDGLRAGASVRDVALALGLDDDELRVGLRAWATGQRRLNESTPAYGLTATDVDEVQALLRPADAGGAP